MRRATRYDMPGTPGYPSLKSLPGHVPSSTRNPPVPTWSPQKMTSKNHNFGIPKKSIFGGDFENFENVFCPELDDAFGSRASHPGTKFVWQVPWKASIARGPKEHTRRKSQRPENFPSKIPGRIFGSQK